MADLSEPGGAGDVLKIGNCFSVPLSEIDFVCCRGSGPGGQYVNCTDSAVQLRWNVMQSAGLPEEVRQRLLRKVPGRITREGVLLLEANGERSQIRNRAEALSRLEQLLQSVAGAPVKRRPTKPTRASRERRLESKRRQSRIKRLRRGGED